MEPEGEKHTPKLKWIIVLLLPLLSLISMCSKVVRRVSVNERSSLYRREHHKEAMVWQERGRQPEPQDDDEDRQTDNELHQHATMVMEVLHGKCFSLLFL